jgi:hypothetical protein
MEAATSSSTTLALSKYGSGLHSESLLGEDSDGKFEERPDSLGLVNDLKHFFAFYFLILIKESKVPPLIFSISMKTWFVEYRIFLKVIIFVC